MKKLKNYFIDMISDAAGHINSKIVMGIISFIIATILAFLKYDTQYPIMFLSFSAGSFGFSCFDNKSAFQFKNTSIETKTETINTTKNTDTKIDVSEIVEKVRKRK